MVQCTKVLSAKRWLKMSNEYKIILTKYGVRLQFHGNVCVHDLYEWYPGLLDFLNKVPKNFSILVEFINSKPICEDSAKLLSYARAFLIGRGMRRCAIIFNSSASIVELMHQFKDLGIYNGERYISTQTYPDWENIAENWLLKGIEP